MGLQTMGAGFKLVANDLASPVVGRVGSRFQMMGKKVAASSAMMGNAFKTMAVGMAALKVGTALTGGVAAAADNAGKFAQGIRAIGVISGATSTELKGLHDTAIAAALATQFSPDEAVEGLTNLATAGLTASEAMTTLRPVLDLATGSLGQLGLGEAADAVVGTIKAFGKNVGEATSVTDKLLKITQLTNFQTKDFGTGLSRAASTAGLFKQSLDDTLITMGLLRNLNIEASVASTGLREAWSRLGTDQRTQQLIQKQGIDIFDKQTKAVRPLLDVMSDLAIKLKDVDDKEAFLTQTLGFGRRGMAAFNAVANAQKTIRIDGNDVTLKGAQAIEALRFEMATYKTEQDRATAATKLSTAQLREWGKTAKGSAGAANDFRTALLDTYEGQKKLIGGSVETLKVVVGEGATMVLKPIAAAIFHIVSAVTELLNAIPKPVRAAIIGMFGAIGAIVATAGGFLLLKGILTLLGLSVGGLILSFAKLFLVMLPFTLLLGGMAVAAYAVFRAFQKNVGGAGKTFGDFIDKFKLGFKGAVELMTSGALSSATAKEMEKAENQGVMKFLTSFNRFLNRAEAFWQGIKKGFENGVDQLMVPMQKLKKQLGELFGFGGDSFTGPMSEWQNAGEETGVMLAGLGEIGIEVLSGLIDGAKFLKEAFKGITAGDVKSGIRVVIVGFQTMWTILKAIYQIGVLVKNNFMTIVDVFRIVGSAIGEGIGSIILQVEHMLEVIKAAMSLDFKRVGELKREHVRKMAINAQDSGVLAGIERISTRWGGGELTGVRARFGELARIKEPEDIYKKQENARLQTLKKVEAEREKLLAVGGMRGGRGLDSEMVLDRLDTLNKMLAKLGERPINVTAEIDGDKVMSFVDGKKEESWELDLGGQSIPSSAMGGGG